MSLIDKCSLQAGDKRMDVESYMTIDHFETNEFGKFFRMLDSILKERSNSDKIKEMLENLLDLLIEHSGYEESFIYDYFNNLDANIISGLKYPKGWEPEYFGAGYV